LIGGLRRHKLGVLLAGLVLVIAIGGIAYYQHARNTEVAIESIAVLPFINQGGDPNAEYLSDGLTESIINSLTQLPNLKVIARSSVFRYKGQETDPLKVGKELGVRAVLVGRLVQRGDSLLVSTELVDVRDNKQLWGERYDRGIADLFAVQDEIANAIAATIQPVLSLAEQRRAMRRPAIVKGSAEGTRLVTNLIEIDAAEVRIGLPVEVEFVAVDPGLTLPMFRPLRD
jgi:TolB-like protein